MKKLASMLIIIFCCVLCSCSFNENATTNNANDNSYDEGYDNGYQKGFDKGYEEGYTEGYVNASTYEEEYRDFEKAIISLMYDGEYTSVKNMMRYYPKGVKNALEREFGVSDMNIIIDYLENN